MEQRIDDQLSPYRIFPRSEWASLRADTPMTLSAGEVARLRSLNDQLDMAEVEEIYLPHLAAAIALCHRNAEAVSLATALPGD